LFFYFKKKETKLNFNLVLYFFKNFAFILKTILSHAPVRLLKLNFKRLEQLLRQEINAADEEIYEESLALNQNKDVNEILKRHEVKILRLICDKLKKIITI
jgi:hypothetical protein